MPIQFAALVPGAPSIAKFLSKQLKDPAMRALGMDPLSRAFRKAMESFLLSLQREYQRTQSLQTLLQASIEESVSAFIDAEPVQDVLALAFKGEDSINGSTLGGLWKELPGVDGKKLVELPLGFDWNAVSASYIHSVRAILGETPQLREIWLASNVDDLRRSVDAMRGVQPRFSIEKYRDVLIEEFGTLKLSVMRASYGQALGDRTVSLQSIYIRQQVKEAFPPLDISRDYRKRLQAEARLFGVTVDSVTAEGVGEYRRAPIRPLDDVLADPSCRRLVVLGDPGLGKSTLLQHLALNWAQRASTAVPFLIELRKYTRDHARPRTFLEFMESGTWSHCRLPQGELDRYLRDAETVVLFDGLDEIFDESLRANIVTEIINFSRDYPNARVVTTTRVMGYAVGSPNPDHFRSASFRQFTLQDFGDREIREFVQKWHDAAVPDALEREELAARLLQAVTGSKAIRELAGNPLLLTMMVLLNRRKNLPRERLKLYESCAELLVEGWDAARHLDRSEYLTHDDKIEILQRVAFAMQDERDGLAGNMISEARLKNVLVLGLQDRGVANPRVAAQKIVDAFSERDFMLCFIGDDQFAFVHRTFLEYFCAKEYKSHLGNVGDANELLEMFRTRWTDDAWHEVLRLVCAMVGPDLGAKLIRVLLSAKVQENGWQAIFLASECVSEIRQVGRVEAERETIARELAKLLEYVGTGHIEEIPVRIGALERLLSGWPGEGTREILYRATRNQYFKVRNFAVDELIRRWPGQSTLQWLIGAAAADLWNVRQAAIHGLVTGWPQESTLHLLLDRVDLESSEAVLRTLLRELGRVWPQKISREWLTERANDKKAGLRSIAMSQLAERWPDEAMRQWLEDRLIGDQHGDVRRTAALELAKRGTWNVDSLLFSLARQDEDPVTRDAAIVALGWHRKDELTRQLLLRRMTTQNDAQVRSMIVTALAVNWNDEEIKSLLLGWAMGDKQAKVREAALWQVALRPNSQVGQSLLERIHSEPSPNVRRVIVRQLARNWKDEATRDVLSKVAKYDEKPEVRQATLEELAMAWTDEPTRQILIERSTEDQDEKVRQAAINALSEKFDANN